MRTVIVSGISRGLGAAIFDQLLQEAVWPVGIGRRFAGRHHAAAEKNQCSLLTCDFSDLAHIASIDMESTIPKGTRNLVFINSAGVIEPISHVGDINAVELEKSLITNILSPIMLTNSLVALSRRNEFSLKIVNITSGAAKSPQEGLSLYCTGKAAAKNFFDCVAVDHPDVEISNVDPGVLDTEMQRSIRMSSKTNFPEQPRYLKLHESGALRDPIEVAREIVRNEVLY